MTMHEALLSWHDVDRQYVSRKEGGRGFASIGDSVDASIRQLEDYIKKYRGRLIRNNIDHKHQQNKNPWKQK